MTATTAREITTVLTVYKGSDGEATKALYKRLEQLGPIGVIALNLLRACKASERAKLYRGRNYKGAAYDKKQWSMDNLVKELTSFNVLFAHCHNAPMLNIRWGWGIDWALKGNDDPHHHVLYIDLPELGQVSFHTAVRGEGPDYPGEWDGQRGQSADRICRFAGRLLAQAEAAAAGQGDILAEACAS